MIIAVEGTKGFADYEIFMRAMGVALSNPTVDSEIQVWSLGPHKINSFTAAFCNSSEHFLKLKGFKISFYKVTHSWVAENLVNVNYFAYFSLPNDPTSRMCKAAQQIEGVEVGIFRY
jgi:hypothetical protein